jgi:UDP-2,3-diacylglucosamine hydrolase
VYRKPQAFHIHGQKLLIGHGDGLGPNDKGYKRMKKLFTNPLAKWAFSKLHPNYAVRLGRKLSLNNRLISGSEDHSFKGRENEWLIAYCERKLESKEYDSFVFGHRHFPMKVKLSKGAYYFNTGDWIHYDTFGVLDDKGFRLESLKGHEIPSY